MTKLNKITSVLLSAIMVIGLFSVIPFAAGAETKGTSGSFEYTVLDDGTAGITKYIDNGSKTADVPDTIDGYKVTEIGEFAFQECASLTTITIPGSVTKIDGNAISNYGCTALTDIKVDNDNSNYTSVDGVLFNKDKTEILLYPRAKASSYVIPSSVTKIGASAFYYCTNLTSVTIPSSVTKIGVSAFYYCKKLTNVNIPSGVKYIGSGAFNTCESLPSITIPSSVTLIEYGVFGCCKDLKSIEVEADNECYTSVDGVLFNKDKTIIMSYPNAKGSSYVIPDSVTEIDRLAFENCANLKSVTIPDSVTKIGFCAFAVCTGLTSITIPSSVTNIDSCAFQSCVNLTSVTIPEGVAEIDDYTFENCKSLTSVTIPSSVKKIGDMAFGYIDDLNKVSNFTIYGTNGTEAERYANENEFKFVGTAAPVDPTEPTTPSEPTNPTNPTTPSNPTTPTNSTNPTTPTNATTPTNPTNSTAPASSNNSNNTNGNSSAGKVATGDSASVAAMVFALILSAGTSFVLLRKINFKKH